MNRALRDTVAGSFRLSLPPDQQTILVALAAGNQSWQSPGTLRTEIALEQKGLIVRQDQGHVLTQAGKCAVNLLEEAGLYDMRLDALTAPA